VIFESLTIAFFCGRREYLPSILILPFLPSIHILPYIFLIHILPYISSIIFLPYLSFADYFFFVHANIDHLFGLPEPSACRSKLVAFRKVARRRVGRSPARG